MKTFKRTVTIIISLVYVVFLVMCTASPLRRLTAPDANTGTGTDIEPTSGVETVPASLPFSLGTPKVYFATGSFPEDREELTVSLQAGEAALLDRFSSLKSADLRGSADLQEILAWAEQHPDVKVRYSVSLPNGVQLDNDAASADLSGISAEQAEEAVSLLRYLPGLAEINLGSGSSKAALSVEQIAALRAAFPNAAINGSLTLLGREVDPTAETLDLRSLSHSEAASASATLALLHQVKTITLGSAGDNDLTWEDIGLIEAAIPNARVDYTFSLWGKTLNLSDEMLDFNHISMDDRGAAVRQIMPYMTNCKVLDMDFCGVSNEDMAVIRDENPNVDVVRRIWFGSNYSVRTNVTCILASKPSKGGTLYDDVGEQLKYCTKVRYLDLGHNSDILHFDFVRSMPELEVAVISMTGISDLTPFSSCSHLKWLEAGNCRLSDLSPLAACKELRHLNVGTNSGVNDISPLYDLELRRLWLGVGDPVPAEQVNQMRALHPKCEVNTTVPTGKEATQNEGYVMENWKCYQQYLTADWNYYATYGYFPSQRPLGWWKVVFKCFQYNLQDGAYAFSWNDPKYNPHDPDVAPVNTYVIDTSFLDEDFTIPETIIPDNLDDPPGEMLYASTY